MAVTHHYHHITMLPMPETASKGEFISFMAESILLVYMTTKSAKEIE